MSDNLLFVQTQPYTLAGAGAIIGDTTLVLSSMEDVDGVALAMTDFGTIGYGTLEPGNGVQEEQISFSGITQNSNGTATLTGVKTVLMKAPYTQTSGLAKTHAGATQFVISNTAGFYDSMTSKSNDETITGLYTFSQTPIIPVAAPTLDTEVANKKYVDDTAIAGSPDMTTSVKGIAQEATDTQINAGTQAGSTGAELAVNPKYLKDSIYYTQLPSSDQKAALAGSGTPSASNKFVTADTDALKELLANKKTTSTLSENSDTYYPSQKAVKTYVDTQDATRFSISKSGAVQLSWGANETAKTIAHGLGVIPKKITFYISGYTNSHVAPDYNQPQAYGNWSPTGQSSMSIYDHGTNAWYQDFSTSYVGIVRGENRGANITCTADATNITLTIESNPNWGLTLGVCWSAEA